MNAATPHARRLSELVNVLVQLTARARAASAFARTSPPSLALIERELQRVDDERATAGDLLQALIDARAAERAGGSAQ